MHIHCRNWCYSTIPIIDVSTHADLCLKPRVAFTTFVPVKKCLHPSVNRISSVAVEREKSKQWDNTIYRREVCLSKKCGRVNGGNYTKQPVLLNNKFESFHYIIHLQRTSSWKFLGREIYLATFTAILRNLKNWDQNLLTFLQSSRTL